MKNRIAFFLIILIFVIIAVKFASVFLLYAKQVSPSPIQDPLEFRNLARNILQKNVFSSADAPPYVSELYRTPAYPLFLAFTLFFDPSGYLALFFQQILIAILALLLFKLIEQYQPDSRAMPLLFVFFFLADPRIWFWSLETMSETLFMFLAFLSLFLLLYSKSLSSRHVLLAALCFGFAVLVRPTGILWAPGVLLILAFRDANISSNRITAIARGLFVRQNMINGLFFVAIVISIVFPWALRNYLLVGAPIISSAPAHSYAYALGDAKPGNPAYECSAIIKDSKGREGCMIRTYTSESYSNLQKFVGELRGTTPFRAVLKKNIVGAYLFWRPNEYTDILKIVSKMAFGSELPPLAQTIALRSYKIYLSVIGALALLGLVFLYKKRKRLEVSAFSAVFLFNTFFTYGLAGGRHHIPLLPLLLFSASMGACFLLEEIKTRKA